MKVSTLQPSREICKFLPFCGDKTGPKPWVEFFKLHRLPVRATTELAPERTHRSRCSSPRKQGDARPSKCAADSAGRSHSLSSLAARTGTYAEATAQTSWRHPTLSARVSRRFVERTGSESNLSCTVRSKADEPAMGYSLRIQRRQGRRQLTNSPAHRRCTRHCRCTADLPQNTVVPRVHFEPQENRPRLG